MGEIELPVSVLFISVTSSNFVDRLLYSQVFLQDVTLCCHLPLTKIFMFLYIQIMQPHKAPVLCRWLPVSLTVINPE